MSGRVSWGAKAAAYWATHTRRTAREVRSGALRHDEGLEARRAQTAKARALIMANREASARARIERENAAQRKVGLPERPLPTWLAKR